LFKFIYIKLLLLFSILTFTSCSNNNDNQKVVSSVTSQVKFKLTTLNNKTISIEKYDLMLLSKELNNKVVLINFWAPWCNPCVKEMPNLVKLQNKYKKDLIIVAILFDKVSSRQTIDEFVKKYKINFPVTIGAENFNIAKAFNDLQMVPESYLYDKDGVFIDSYIGEINIQKLEKNIEKLIK